MTTEELKSETRELTDDQLDTVAGGKPSLYDACRMIVAWWNSITSNK